MGPLLPNRALTLRVSDIVDPTRLARAFQTLPQGLPHPRFHMESLLRT